MIDRIICLILGFLAGYLFHGWQYDRILERLEARITDLENQN